MTLVSLRLSTGVYGANEIWRFLRAFNEYVRRRTRRYPHVKKCKKYFINIYHDKGQKKCYSWNLKLRPRSRHLWKKKLLQGASREPWLTQFRSIIRFVGKFS